MPENDDLDRAIAEMRALEEYDRDERIRLRNQAAVIEAFEAVRTVPFLTDMYVSGITVHSHEGNWNLSPNGGIVSADKPTPRWQIAVDLNSLGVIKKATVFHDGCPSHLSTNWTDRSTMADVVNWANRTTACDASLTSRHIAIAA